MPAIPETTSARAELAAYLQRFPHLNFYHLGDLDDFFFPHTTWYISRRSGEIDALALLYHGLQPPVLLAIENQNLEALTSLLASLQPHLPAQVYSHLSPGLEPALQPRFHLAHHGEHLKMALIRPGDLPAGTRLPIRPLTTADLPALNDLYAAAYPGNWFDPRMLETGQYLGLPVEDGSLVSVAGVHVYSPDYRVAALGNIATHPGYRGRGLASALTAALCRRLLPNVETIGLNVHSGNAPAVSLYENIGFEPTAVYHEYTLSSK